MRIWVNERMKCFKMRTGKELGYKKRTEENRIQRRIRFKTENEFLKKRIIAIIIRKWKDMI